MKPNNVYKRNQYILFWLTQAISQLGSSLTGFALVVWAYKQTNSAMAISLLSFCNYLPYIIVGVWAGIYVDRHHKKKMMLVCDTIAALASLIILGLYTTSHLKVWHLYGINWILGIMNAFQSPASQVAVGMIVPKEKIEKVSGMNAFSSGLITVVSPMLAPCLLAVGGFNMILVIDLISFSIAFITLAFFIRFDEHKRVKNRLSIHESLKEGEDFLKREKGICYLIFSMAMMNFFSRLTYENILTPMLLSRSGGSDKVLATVTGVIGLGGIIGGMLVSIIHIPFARMKGIFWGAAFSFLLGDVLMGLGQNVWIWLVAGLAASMPIPMINAMQNNVLYACIPKEIQGRVFAIQNSVQYCTIPIGILLGGYLADYVFEPMMKEHHVLLQTLVGTGKGSGMALMFLCTGILGSIISILCYRSPYIRQLEQELEKE
ncbi:MAG: MFS transporter [Cellulosilyticum sp.]|nr:MFS transporter [Cellulosilyticum sp.]